MKPVFTSRSQQENYEQRLLSLYIMYVKETGSIDYPDLKEFLDRVLEVEAAEPGEALLPEQLSHLTQNLRKVQADIVAAAVEISRELVALSEVISSQHNVHFSETDCSWRVRQATQRFLVATEYLLDITNYYVYAPLVKKQQTKKASFRKQEIVGDRPDDVEGVRKLIGDLKYISQYIAEQAQVGVIKSEFWPGDSAVSYFRRLHKYLDILPSLTDMLGNLVCQVLSRKIASRTKFTVPKFQSKVRHKTSLD